MTSPCPLCQGRGWFVRRSRDRPGNPKLAVGCPECLDASRTADHPVPATWGPDDYLWAARYGAVGIVKVVSPEPTEKP